MADILISASADPGQISSGGTTTIEVKCEVSDDGMMTVGSSNGYAITNTRRALKAGQRSDKFSEAITGPPGDCWLTFVFQGSGTETVVAITK